MAVVPFGVGVAQKRPGPDSWLSRSEQVDMYALFIVPPWQIKHVQPSARLTRCLHYFYKMSPDIDCVDLQPVFGLYENGEMIGMGVATFGAKTNTPDRTWLEDVPKSMFAEIVPRRPNCMMDWLEDYGLITLHLFFKEVPTTTPCAESVC